MFCHRDGAARILPQFHCFYLHCDVFMLEYMMTGIVRERECTWRGTWEDRCTKIIGFVWVRTQAACIIQLNILLQYFENNVSKNSSKLVESIFLLLVLSPTIWRFLGLASGCWGKAEGQTCWKMFNASPMPYLTVGSSWSYILNPLPCLA